MKLQDLQHITHPIEIEGDTHNFAAAAFQRAAGALPDEIDETTIENFKSFLEAEAAEMLRQAVYYEAMTPYYDENVAASRRLEAIAFETMLAQSQDQLVAA